MIYIFYVLALFLTAVLGAVLAAIAQRQWQIAAARPLSFLMACVAWWGLFAGLSAIVPNGETARVLGVQFRFTGAILVAPAALLFALTYNGRTEWLKRDRVALIMIVPVLTLLLNWTAAFHDLFVFDVVYERIGEVWLRTAWHRGPWFSFIYNPYSYGLLIFSLTLLANEARLSHYPYRQQAYLIFVGGLVPLVASIPATFDLLSGPDLDLIVMGFFIMGVLYAAGLSRFHLLDIMPIARGIVIENMIDPMLILDNEDRVVEINPSLYSRLGLSRRESLGMSLEEIFARWPDLLAKYKAVDEGQLVISVPANDRIYHFDVQISPILKDDRQLGRLIVWRDITKLKETELAFEAGLRRTESLYMVAESLSGLTPLEDLFQTVVERVASALAANRVALIVVDQEAEMITHFVGGGVGAADVWRIPYEELMEGLSGWVLRQGQPTLSLKDSLDPRESTAVQKRRQETAAGSIIVTPINYREQVLGTLTAIRRPEEPDFREEDVGLLQAMANQAAVAIENTRLYETLAEQVAELKESNEALQAFSQMVAHDLKGPLSVMIGYAELIIADNSAIQIPDADLRQYAELMYGTSRKMSGIINDLLLLSRIRRPEDVPLATLDMGKILQETLRRLRWQIDQSAAEIKCPNELPVVVGYGPWVEEVWVNYISNSLKYGGGKPRIVLGFDLDWPKAEGQVRFWVRDWGPGISAEGQKKLFIEFSRVGELKIQGHGLGLSIVRRIVERMGGKVGAESQEGAGSLFWFTLPTN